MRKIFSKKTLCRQHCGFEETKVPDFSINLIYEADERSITCGQNAACFLDLKKNDFLLYYISEEDFRTQKK